MRIAALVLLMILSVTGTSVGAQQSAASLMPGPDEIGDDWVMIGQTGYLDMVPVGMRSFIDDSAVTIFGGPNGARISVYVFRTDGSPRAIRQSWDATNGLFENIRGDIDYGYDTSRERELANAPLPAGCADARRTYGEESTSPRFKVGLTLCAVDPDLTLLVFTSGPINGLSGQPAADAIVELVLAGGVTEP